MVAFVASDANGGQHRDMRIYDDESSLEDIKINVLMFKHQTPNIYRNTALASGFF